MVTAIVHRLGDSYRNISYSLVSAATVALLRVRLFWQVRLGLLKVYQPHPFGEHWRGNAAELRACTDRLEAIVSNLPTDIPLSTLDIGCNLGYFTFQMAQRGGLCIGIDAGRKEIMAAEALARIYDAPNAIFTRMQIAPGIGPKLPQVDLVICLSIFHHLVRSFGEPTALEIMEQVAGAANRFLVFETGQPNEATAKWASELSFMGPDPDTWTRNFLVGLGFHKVSNLGSFPTSVSQIPRHLYLAERKANMPQSKDMLERVPSD